METSLMFNVARSSLSSALIIDRDDRYQSRSRYDQCHYQEIEINITQLYDNVWRLLAICATDLIVWAFCFHHKVHVLLLWLRKTRSKGRVLYLWTPFQIGGDLKVKSSDKYSPCCYSPSVWVKFWQTKKRICPARVPCVSRYDLMMIYWPRVAVEEYLLAPCWGSGSACLQKWQMTSETLVPSFTCHRCQELPRFSSNAFH